MRRADRLFRIVEYLKSRREVVTGETLAAEMEIGVRTIYRDVADLRASGVPIVGEAGVGYLLSGDYVVKPLMFDIEELDALSLGAQMVESWGDTDIARAARRALDKITAVLPDRLAEDAKLSAAYACASRAKTPIKIDLASLRRAVRSKHWVDISYTDEAKKKSQRRVRPLCLVFSAPVWLLAAWCETRGDFREFRVDRITRLKVTNQRFPYEAGKTLKDLQQQQPKAKVAFRSAKVVQKTNSSPPSPKDFAICP
ncbi:helix-turn-helix transcriptional regulator [Roseimaritima ulvae]|uniref:HTH domain protein n=1 Tax=Roseimaritima ulvae TaxID=980254 RepID=A0A5B9QKD5_9BACT|nr:YafY family protein [Roseimaritima ulvae]QEG39334.1 HTH domain protein [Roseimaritima ulvae]